MTFITFRITVKKSRFPKFYDGTSVTTQSIQELLPPALLLIKKEYERNPTSVLNSWNEIIGPQWSSMTRAISFFNGKLTVKVNNSTLYSLLNQYEKPRLLALLQKKLPQAAIKEIRFCIG